MPTHELASDRRGHRRIRVIAEAIARTVARKGEVASTEPSDADYHEAVVINRALEQEATEHLTLVSPEGVEAAGNVVDKFTVDMFAAVLPVEVRNKLVTDIVEAVREKHV